MTSNSWSTTDCTRTVSLCRLHFATLPYSWDACQARAFSNPMSLNRYVWRPVGACPAFTGRYLPAGFSITESRTDYLYLRGLDAGNRVWLPGESILLRSHWVLVV